MQALKSLQQMQKMPASELVQINNTAVLAKFCDVCKRLNIDPLHAQALPCVVLLMSKNKHCVQMAHAYAGLVQSCEKAQDAELRCLRAMTSFKDTKDDEEATTRTMPLVMQCFSVHPDFTRSVATVLRKRMLEIEDCQDHHSQPSRQLLRTYASQAVVKSNGTSREQSWKKWVNDVVFPVNTGSHMQRLLYFFCVQPVAPNLAVYEKLYTQELCARSKTVSIDAIDVSALKMVIDSLRQYTSNMKVLIDFSARCLQGINEHRRQNLSLVQLLQLYVACYQHDSVWKELWRHVLEPVPVLNHTIVSDCAVFRATHAYEATAVAENLVRSLVDE